MKQNLFCSQPRSIKFLCAQCDHKASTKGNLIKHIKSIHEGVKFPCDQCDYKATKKGNLIKHIKSIHERVKFPCAQCDYKATEKGHLLSHIRSIHIRIHSEYVRIQNSFRICLAAEWEQKKFL